MRYRIPKILTAAVLCTALILNTAGVSKAAPATEANVVQATQGAAVTENKDEVVYANLNADGSVSAVHVVNHFEVAQGGSITDHGAYSSVVNLTDTGLLKQQDGTVTFDAQQGNFYYQGNMETADLPWLCDISYYLDGVSISPQELAGKSGRLEIRISTRKNEAVNAVFYDNYLLQISMTLDSEKCSDVESAGATVASAGKNMVIAHTVMPGKDADITLSAAVSDFEMDGIDITAMPFSMNVDLPDTNDMVSDFEQLTDAISDLNDGVGDLLDGVADMKSGANKLKNGSADIKDGLSQLSGNSGALTAASAQIRDALAQIVSSLGGGDFDPGELAQLPDGLTQLAQGLDGISGGLVDLKDAFTPAYAALDAAMQDIPDTTITQAQLTDLYAQTDPSQHGLLDDLVGAYEAGQNAKGTYNSVKEAFDAVGSTIDTLSGSIGDISGTLNGMADSIEAGLTGLDQMDQLISGLTELPGNYGAFHIGLTEYMGGVTDLADGYADFHTGLSAFSRGVGDLYDGVAELHDGTGELADETADMPDTMQSEIDDMLDEYTGGDFEPVSFMSPLNGNMGLVQFVFKCGGIKLPDEDSAPAEETQQATIWNRFLALFGG